MKTFLLIFIFALSLKADYLYMFEYTNSTYTFCIKDYAFISNSLKRTLSSDNSTATVPLTSITNISILDGYQYISGACLLKPTTNTNQVLISSLTGILIGFTILFFAIFLTIKVGSRK